jgi:hypothetical protein
MLVSLNPAQREPVRQCFEKNTGLSPLFTDHFTLFLQLFCGLFELPPYAEKEPAVLVNLFKGSSARYQLLEMEALASQLPTQQQLYLGLKIADSILQIKRENDDKLHLFNEWYLVLLQIAQRGVKYSIEKLQLAEPY